MNIMFNDHYGLTAAVLDGIKTKTRRLVPAIPPYMLDGKAYACESLEMVMPIVGEKVMGYFGSKVGWQLLPQKCQPRYKLGVLYGVAQSYQSIFEDESLKKWRVSKGMHREDGWIRCDLIENGGWKNKMLVCDDLMPYQIRITKIRVERLRDISSADCLAEGILKKSDFPYKKTCPFYFAGGKHEWDNSFHTPRQAYAALIDKISGKGTWERNPWVYAYDFKLIK